MDYYGSRADDYDRYYRRLNLLRLDHHRSIEDAIRNKLPGLNVLEVASGTGHWTSVAAQVASHVTAIDISPGMLAVARSKGLPPDKVVFQRSDAYDLSKVSGSFDAGMANFWISHVPRSLLARFLESFHRRLGHDSLVFMADTACQPGNSVRRAVRPAGDDTYSQRRMSDGSPCRILQNIYSEHELVSLLEPCARDLDVHYNDYFWWASYRVDID